MEYTEECSNIYYILSNLDETSKKRIPKELFNFFDEKRNKEYKVNIDLNKPIYEQKLDNNTIEILSEIYQKYLCSDEEKIQFIREKNNIQSAFDYSSIFKNNSNSNISVNENNLPKKEMIVQEDKNIFRKIISKIKKILKII